MPWNMLLRSRRVIARRRQRGQDPLRRRIQKRRLSEYNFKFLLLGFISCTVVAYWVVCISLLQLQHDSDSGISNPSLPFSHVGVQTHAIPVQQKPRIVVNASNHWSPQKPQIVVNASNEVIDMRQLNQHLAFDNPDGGAWKQGWDVQPVPLDPKNPLKVFVVPHSHCDPGWIKTFDEYFQSQTKSILSSVISSLSKHNKRKFIWAEISYFEWWWKEQDENTRQLVRKLLHDKQFEFVTGGWVQPDEANTQLYAMEIQLQEGHDFIRETFGEQYIPKFGWAIDPFGYSPTMAYLLKKYNFQAMLIQRVHYAIKKDLALHKQLEFLWRQTWDTAGDYDMFTHVMPFYSYDVPHTCGPDPSVCCQFDFARLRGSPPANNGERCPWGKQPEKIHDGNVAQLSKLLLDQYRKKSALYKSNVVIAPLGDDFRYQTIQEADNQFDNYQRIFDYLNENVDGVEIQFGTLSNYFNAVLGKFEAPLLKGSFFTYADRNEDYWSGYFTSRIFDKALDRHLERVLYAATSLGATKAQMKGPRRALSLFQHHDGVTGTAKTNVVTDYAKRIYTAIQQCQDWMIQELSSKQQQSLTPCWRSNAPREMSQNLCSSDVLLYNPLEWPQICGDTMVPGRSHVQATLPCEVPGAASKSSIKFEFDPNTGLMTHPIREEWMVWKVKQGGAYLFFPGKLEPHPNMGLKIEQGGFVVESKDWKRTVVEKTSDIGSVIDFVYETNLQTANQEWFVRLSTNIANGGVFHTDLNGFNFDTHDFRPDMPIQSQVFPMPTHASIEDSKQRLTVLSEHAQGTASLRDGSIDVWLDRRLAQDDGRGLGQGVMDNVPTRTRLRVVLETEGYDYRNPEFVITPFTKRMWKELNHPLEMFGLDEKAADEHAASRGSAKRRQLKNDESSTKKYYHKVPPVYMVYNRVDYFKQSIDSLRESDFPRKEVPIIVSHDGHIDEMVQYVDSIKSDFFVIQIFHPFACSEHKDIFPGDDPKLNENYKGDAYGHKREGRVTCCKHHFTWLINQVFTMDEVADADGFLFLEEDYVVAETIYETIQTGFEYIVPKGDYFFGVTLDITEGYQLSFTGDYNMWHEKRFHTGPVAFRRDMFQKIKDNAREYCTFDDYNWDWSLVHMMGKMMVPWRVLTPGTLQVSHIGLEGGLHSLNTNHARISQIKKRSHFGAFHVQVDNPNKTGWTLKSHNKGYGGWGHPVDHEHCIKLFSTDVEKQT